MTEIKKWTERTPTGQYLAGIDRLQHLMQAEIDEHRAENSRLKAQQPMTDEQIEAAFGEKYKNDLALLQLSRENKDYALEAIGARHHFAAFKTAIKSAEAFHNIKGATE